MKTRNWFFLFLISIICSGITEQIGWDCVSSAFNVTSFLLFWAWLFHAFDD